MTDAERIALDGLTRLSRKPRPGEVAIEFSWCDEPGFWRTWGALNPALSSTYQLGLLRKSGEAGARRYAPDEPTEASIYVPLLRVKVIP